MKTELKLLRKGHTKNILAKAEEGWLIKPEDSEYYLSIMNGSFYWKTCEGKTMQSAPLTKNLLNSTCEVYELQYVVQILKPAREDLTVTYTFFEALRMVQLGYYVRADHWKDYYLRKTIHPEWRTSPNNNLITMVTDTGRCITTPRITKEMRHGTWRIIDKSCAK